MYDPIESYFIKKLLQAKIKVVVAAGNDGFDLDKECKAFPACANKGLIVVGALDMKCRNRSPMSNYGKIVKHWQRGEKVEGGGIFHTGTSQATAVETAKQAKTLLKHP